MDTRNRERLSDPGGYDDELYEEPGLGAWLKRNRWLLLRLFMVMVFAFGAATTASNFSYGLKGNPVEITAEQINNGQLPTGLELGDYVEISGSPSFGPDPQKIGSPDSNIGVSSRYSAAYFYFSLEETGDNLLIQTAQTPPDIEKTGEQVWSGKLATVGTTIFYNTTQEGLEQTGLPHDKSIPVIATGDTPEYYRQIFPSYAAIIGLWLLCIGWLVWKRNKPFV